MIFPSGMANNDNDFVIYQATWRSPQLFECDFFSLQSATIEVPPRRLIRFCWITSKSFLQELTLMGVQLAQIALLKRESWRWSFNCICMVIYHYTTHIFHFIKHFISFRLFLDCIDMEKKNNTEIIFDIDQMALVERREYFVRELAHNHRPERTWSKIQHHLSERENLQMRCRSRDYKLWAIHLLVE